MTITKNGSEYTRLDSDRAIRSAHRAAGCSVVVLTTEAWGWWKGAKGSVEVERGQHDMVSYSPRRLVVSSRRHGKVERVSQFGGHAGVVFFSRRPTGTVSAVELAASIG